jgi:L-alanine-DL-glutamate epimerase-like enolase superfamily enzyme
VRLRWYRAVARTHAHQELLAGFVGKDARDLESLLDGICVANSNYKWQGLPFWVPLASLEFALLDLLGRVAGKPLRPKRPRFSARRAS